MCAASLAAIVGWLNGTLLNIMRDNEPIEDVFKHEAASMKMELTEVAPEEFGREAYEKIRLVTAYLGQYIQRGNDDVQLIISLQPDGMAVVFKKGVAMLAYGLGRDDKSYLLYFSPEEKFVIMTRKYMPLLDILAPSEEAAMILSEILRMGPPRQGNK